MVFSYIMGEFSEMLMISYKIDDELEEGEELDKFLGLLKYFNNNQKLSYGFVCNLRSYFEYRW